jgi:hypothetical protein
MTARVSRLESTIPASEADSITAIVFQSPGFDTFSTLTLSYNAKTGSTLGFFGYNEDELNESVIQSLKAVLGDGLHPLLLPALFFRAWITRFAWENIDQGIDAEEVKNVTYPTNSSSNPQTDIDKAHTLIVHIRLGDVPPWNVPWNVPARIDRY